MAVAKQWQCTHCQVLNTRPGKFCVACGLYRGVAPVKVESKKQKPAKAPSNAPANSELVEGHRIPTFADRISLQLLLERVVPPYRPPSADPGAAWLFFAGLSVLLVPIGLVCFAHGMGAIGILLLLAAGVFAYLCYVDVGRRNRRAAEYVAVHQRAVSMATRMLTGTPQSGDREDALRRLADWLMANAEPAAGGSTWLFVWWEG